MHILESADVRDIAALGAFAQAKGWSAAADSTWHDGVDISVSCLVITVFFNSLFLCEYSAVHTLVQEYIYDTSRGRQHLHQGTAHTHNMATFDMCACVW